MIRIGILGGAFDPPHIGHLIGAESVSEEFRLKKVIFIPTNIPPHKSPLIALSQERFEMVKIAIQDKPHFEISDMEIKREGVSYTIDTIIELKQIYPDDELFLIIGMDEAKDFMSWKEPHKLLSICKFIILTRPGFKKDELPDLLRKDAKFFSLHFDISSTNLRELVKNGTSIQSCVPGGVANYIKDKRLYL